MFYVAMYLRVKTVLAHFIGREHLGTKANGPRILKRVRILMQNLYIPLMFLPSSVQVALALCAPWHLMAKALARHRSCTLTSKLCDKQGFLPESQLPHC